MQTSMVRARPFTASAAVSTRKATQVAAVRRMDTRSARLRTRSAEAEAPAEAVEVVEEEEQQQRGPRGRFAAQDTPQFKHFLPLPKPAHLVFIKPTVAVVAGTATRSSVGLKMTAGDNQLERYVIEFYSKSVK